MAAEHSTPVDQLDTGLPLPILPPDNVLPQADSGMANWHHHAHPRRDPLLQEEAGMAVRNARLQLTAIADHNAYHKYYVGPPLPATPSRQFTYTIMAAAGYVPASAIDISRKRPRQVSLSHEQRNRLWESGELKIGSVEVLRRFMKSYILSQDLDYLHENVVDEFLNSSDGNRRKYLGHLLLAKQIEHAAEPVDITYRIARKNGLIHPAFPATLPTFLTYALGKAKRRKLLIREFEARILARVA